MRKFLIPLLTALWVFPAFAGGLTDMTNDERLAFGDAVRAYLLQNPEVLMEAIQVLEQRQQQAQAETDQTLVLSNAEEIFNDGYSYVGGNLEGDITLVEFQDYRCSYCRKAHDEVAELVRSDGNIRLVIKEFPILGEASTDASRLAVATLHKLGPEAYHDLANFLITFNGDLNPKISAGILEKLGHDPSAVIAYLDDAAITGHIGKVHTLARTLKITGTPTFVVGNEMVRGYVSLETMREIIAFHRQQQN